MYPHALEAGFFCTTTPPPLQALFCDVLRHFSLAPNGWHHIANFYKLCGSFGVPPSLTLFRRFLRLCMGRKSKGLGWSHFRSSLPARLPSPNVNWREECFLLSSPAEAPCPCPVQWGEPSEESKIRPVLKDNDETAMAEEVLRARGGLSVDTDVWVTREETEPWVKRVKTEPRSDNDTVTGERSPSSGRKRSLEEANMPQLQVC